MPGKTCFVFIDNMNVFPLPFKSCILLDYTVAHIYIQSIYIESNIVCVLS